MLSRKLKINAADKSFKTKDSVLNFQFKEAPLLIGDYKIYSDKEEGMYRIYTRQGQYVLSTKIGNLDLIKEKIKKGVLNKQDFNDADKSFKSKDAEERMFGNQVLVKHIDERGKELWIPKDPGSYKAIGRQQEFARRLDVMTNNFAKGKSNILPEIITLPDGFKVYRKTGQPVSGSWKDAEPGFDIRNIEEETVANNNFRKVLVTGNNIQLVLMSLLPNEDIGMETHPAVDQFFRIEEGEGEVEIQGSGKTPIKSGSSITIKAGTQHNIINTSSDKPLKLYTLYAPPNHGPDIVQKTKAEAAIAEKEGTDVPPTRDSSPEIDSSKWYWVSHPHGSFELRGPFNSESEARTAVKYEHGYYERNLKKNKWGEYIISEESEPVIIGRGDSLIRQGFKR